MVSILVGLAGIGASFTGGAWAFARLYAKPQRRHGHETPATYGLDFRSISFGGNPSPLSGWLVRAPGEADARAPLIVVAHGWSSDKASMLPTAVAINDTGMHCLLFDARGHGESPGDGPITIRKFAEDIAAAIAHARSEMASASGGIGVVGHSIGGGAAILAASADPGIRCVVSCSAFAHPFTLTRRTLKRLHLPRGPFLWGVRRFLERWLAADMHTYAPALRIAEVRAPVLLFHGTRDRYVPPVDMEEVAHGATRGNAAMVRIDGARHFDIIRDARYLRQTTRFLRQHLTAVEGVSEDVCPASARYAEGADAS